MKKDFSHKVKILGSGPAGATTARLFAEEGFQVDLYEKREHIAGNCFDRKVSAAKCSAEKFSVEFCSAKKIVAGFSFANLFSADMFSAEKISAGKFSAEHVSEWVEKFFGLSFFGRNVFG